MILLPLILLAAPVVAAEAQPQLAARGTAVALVYGEDGKIAMRFSADGGLKFGEPTRIPVSGKLMAGRHRGPRIAFGDKAIVVTGISEGNLWAWRSIDDGKVWSGAVRVNDRDRAAREGLHAMAAGRDFVAVAWLDLRDDAMKLYFSQSRDGGETWSPNVLVYSSPDGHICECCHPSMAIGANGEITVMFRNWLGGARDMYWTQSRDRGETWSKAQQFGKEHWMLNACPMDGGGLTVLPNGTPVSVWRRGTEIFVSEAGKPEKLIGAGKDAAMVAGEFLVWTTPEGIAMWKGRPYGLIGPGGAYAVAVGVPDGAVVAWEREGRVVTRLIGD